MYSGEGVSAEADERKGDGNERGMRFWWEGMLEGKE